MKIQIFVLDDELAQMLFKEVVGWMKGANLRGQVSIETDYARIKQQLLTNSYEYDIILLDAMNLRCLDVAKQIRSNNFLASIIFLSKNSRKIPNILLYRPSALITKFDDNMQLINAIRWSCGEQRRVHPFFTVNNKDTIIKVYYADILWFESHQRTVTLHSKTQEITFYAKLSDVYSIISHDIFLRCHQSFIVNYNMIRKIDKVSKCIYLVNGTSIDISKSCYQQVIEFASRE